MLLIREQAMVVAEKVNLERLADLVRRTRAQKGLKLADVRKRGGPVPSWLSKLESGSMIDRPKRSTLEKLAQGLGIPLHAVLIAAGEIETEVFDVTPPDVVGAPPPLEIPPDVPEPPDPWELEVLHKIGAMDFGQFDPRRDDLFWYEPREARRRHLRNLEDLWFERQARERRHG